MSPVASPVAPPADPRVIAFCSRNAPEVFHSVATPTEIWAADPFDVPTIHAEAREGFEQLLHRASRLPDDWLERYLEGIQEVGPEDVQRVYREHVHPERMVILVVGDPGKMDEPLAALGPVTVLEVEEPAALLR